MTQQERHQALKDYVRELTVGHNNELTPLNSVEAVYEAIGKRLGFELNLSDRLTIHREWANCLRDMEQL